MGYLQKMEDECDCLEVIFQDYIQSRSTHNVFLFFEGKDDFKYYWCRLSPYVGEQKYKKYVCNKKDNVLAVYEMIISKTKPKAGERTLYFIDKDFDRINIHSEDIYMTPTYAIENFYISNRAIENMLIGEWGLSSEMQVEDRQDFEIALSFLISKRNEIIESMLYANAWYSLQRNKTKQNPPFPKLSAIKEYRTIKNVQDKEVLKNMVANSIELTDEEIENEMEYLREKPAERLRGKYFEQTMPSYIMQVFQDSNKKTGREMFSKRRKVNINVGEDNMVSVLSNYADVPRELIAYIGNRFREYTNE